MKQFNEILKQLCDNDTIQGILKAENQVETKDDNELMFKTDNETLNVKITENGLVMSYSYKADDIRDKFTKYCNEFDDEFFQAICDEYTKSHGEGSLNILNKNLNKESIADFNKSVSNVVNNYSNKLEKYKKNLIEFNNGL